ncbi:MAG: ADP-ribosylglycohydrolase family protein [Streptomycetaceae bacterium]|nr:ADP-ribosylglycohydrolase family protein [Streptomycetaceae bacterium]
MNRFTHAAALVGTAVGDALGAPFELTAPGALSARFPSWNDVQLNGGGGWDSGEATDDTQMAVHVALSIVDHRGVELPDIFDRFVAWQAADPKDVGLQTEVVLTSGLPYDRAADDYLAHHHLAAGNGSLMRAIAGALYGATLPRPRSAEAARAISRLTHADPATGEGCVIFHELIRVALDGGNPIDALPTALAQVREDERDRWATVLVDDWHPDKATEFNGAVWPALGSAVWALRHTRTFRDAVCVAVDLGGDTDTVAAITGGLAGAVYGLDGIPADWRAAVHVPLPGARPGERAVWDADDLARLADALAG